VRAGPLFAAALAFCGGFTRTAAPIQLEEMVLPFTAHYTGGARWF